MKVGRELGTVRSLNESEKEQYMKDKEESKRKIAMLRETLNKQMQKANQREEELQEENDDLRRQIRALSADLETEKRIHEELGRLGAGLSTDKSLLRSKLSENEMRLVDFAEKMSESEKTTRELHEKQKRNRKILDEAVSNL